MADNINTYKYQLTSGDGKTSKWVDGKDFDANYEQYAKDCSKGSTIRTKDPKTGEEYDTPLTSYKAALADGVRPFTKVTVNRPQVTEQAKAVATKPRTASAQKAQGALESATSATSSRTTDQPNMAVLEKTKQNWENILNSGAADNWNADALLNPTKGKLNDGTFDTSQHSTPFASKQKKTPITQTPRKSSLMVTKDENGRIVQRSRYVEGLKADKGTDATLKSIEAQLNQFADSVTKQIDEYIGGKKAEHQKNDLGFLNNGGGQGGADFGDDTNAKLSAQRYQMLSPGTLFGEWTKDSKGNRVWKEGTLSEQGGAVDRLLASALFESDGNGGARIKKSIERDAYGKGMSVNGYVSSVLVPKIQEQLMSRINQNEVVRNMPKNDMEYFLKSMRDSALGMILNSQKTSAQERAVQQQAMQQYEKDTDMGIVGHAIHAAGTTVGDLPLLMVGGWVGKGVQAAGGTVARAVGKTALGATMKEGLTNNVVTRALATYTPKIAEAISPTVKRFASPQLAHRYEQFILANASKPQWYGRELMKGALASPANMETFMGLKNVEETAYYAGGDTSGAALWDAWNQGAAEGLKMGTVLNAVAPFGRYLGLKASTPLGRFGANTLGKGLEIGSFMGMDYMDKTSRGEDWQWTQSLAENGGMIIGMGVAAHPAHAIGSVLRGARKTFWYKTGKKTINPDNGMMEDTYAFNPVKAWRQLMSKDNNVKDLALSKEAKAQLKKAFPNDPFFDDAYDAYNALGLTKGNKADAFENALKSGDPVALKTVKDYNNKLQALLQDKENVSWRVRNEISAKMYGVGEASRPLYDHYKIEGNETKLYAADGELIDSRIFNKSRGFRDVLAGQNGYTDEEYADMNKHDMQDFINGERNIAFYCKAKDLMLQVQGITDKNDAELFSQYFKNGGDTEEQYQEWQKNSVELLDKDPRKMDWMERMNVRSLYNTLRNAAWFYNYRKGILSLEAATDMGHADANDADLAGKNPNPDVITALKNDIADRKNEFDEATKIVNEVNANGGYGIDIDRITIQELYEYGMPADDKQKFLDYISAYNRYANAQVRYDAFIKATGDKINEHIDDWFEGVRFRGDGFANPDMVALVTDGEGKQYYLIDGTVDEGRITSESGMVGVVDRETGETDWVDPSKLTFVGEEDKKTHVGGLREFMKQQITAQYGLGDVPQAEGKPEEQTGAEPQQPQNEVGDPYYTEQYKERIKNADSKDIEDIKSAIAENTESAYREYLDNHQEGDFREIARDGLRSLGVFGEFNEESQKRFDAAKRLLLEPPQPQGEGAVAPEMPHGEAPQQPQIPTHEDGTPIYEQLEPKKTVELLNQLYNNDADDVSLHIANEIAKAGADAKTLQSKLDKFTEKVKSGKPIDMNERKAVKDALAEATARGQYWQGVKDMLEGEALAPTNAGETATVDDAQAFEQHKQTYQQNRTQGSHTFIYLPNGEKVSGHFVLGETGDTMPSHDPFNNYKQTAGVPRKEDGTTNNDRDYEHDEEAQRINMEHAMAFHLPNDVPVVSKDEGVVLSGNDRTMAHMIAARNGKAALYEQELREKIGQYGFTEDDMAKYEHPEVRFELDETVPYTTETYAKFNAEEKKSMNSTEASVKNAKLLSENPQAVKSIMQVLRDHDDLADFYKDAESQKSVVDMLVKSGIWSDTDVVAYLGKDGNLTRRGRLEFENVVRGLAFTEDAIRMLDSDEMVAINNAVVRAIPSLVENNSLGEYSVMRVMEGAVKTVYDAISHGNYRNGNIFDYFLQKEAFDEEGLTKEFMRKNEDGSDVYNEEEKALGVVLSHVLAKAKRTNSVKFLSDFLDSYNKQAKNELDNMKGNIFGMTALTPAEVSKAFREAKMKEQITFKDKEGNETTKPRFDADEIDGIERSIKTLLGTERTEGGTGEEHTEPAVEPGAPKTPEPKPEEEETLLTEEDIRKYGGDDDDLIDDALDYINGKKNNFTKAAYIEIKGRYDKDKANQTFSWIDPDTHYIDMSDEELRPIADRFIAEYSDLHDGNIADVANEMMRKLRIGYNKANALVDDYIRRHEEGGTEAPAQPAQPRGNASGNGATSPTGGAKPKPTRSKEQDAAADEFSAALDGFLEKNSKLLSVVDHLDDETSRAKFRAVVKAATKLGYHMVKDGLRDADDWKKDFSERFGDKAMQALDMTKREWNEFLDDIWNNKQFRDGEKGRYTLAEWAKYYEENGEDSTGDTVPTKGAEDEVHGNNEGEQGPAGEQPGDNDGRPDAGTEGEHGAENGTTGGFGEYPADDVDPSDIPDTGGNSGNGGVGTDGHGGGTRGGSHVGGSSSGNDSPKPGGEGTTTTGGTETPRPDAGYDGSAGTTGDEGGNKPLNTETTLNSEKVDYAPHSKGKSLHSVVPAGFNDAMKKNLDEIGDVDEYVRKALGYKDNDEMFKALVAEQIDGVALALKSMRQGYGAIIADQTGLGKGRQAASIIRYGIRNGLKPVFFTEKPSLFTDFYRDMVDTGNGDKKPFIIASDADKGEIDYEGKVIPLPTDEEYQEFMQTGKIPDGYDYAVVTYSQIHTNGEEATGETHGGTQEVEKDLVLDGRRKAVADMCRNNVVVFDEAHNAAGQSSTGRYCQQLVRDARGVTFFSATYAKRPDNMVIYALRSVLSDANVTEDQLIKAIKKGGPVYQEVLSRALAESGALIRRERDMRCVTIDYEKSAIGESEQRETYDKAIRQFREINEYQKSLVDIAKRVAEQFPNPVNGKPGSVNMTSNRSRLFNFTNQMFMGLKVEDAIRKTVEILNKEEEVEVNGEKRKTKCKVFIPLFNTNENMLTDFFEVGKEIDKNDLSKMLERCLDKCMIVKINGTPVDLRDYMEPEELGEYNRIKDDIESMEIGLALSPIDALMEGIRKAGFKVGEITGRGSNVVYGEDGKVTLEKRKIPDPNDVVNDYNNGDLDVVIVNSSGSTGLSMHASEKFKDQRKRYCVTLQAQLDVNTETQIRGRVDRTGQLYHAAYNYLVSHIPAEARVMMMLKTKLKSLDAQTTASQKSEFNEMETQDFANKYGSMVIVDILKEDPRWAEMLDDPFGWKHTKNKDEDTAREEYVAEENDYNNVMKRIAMLDTADQEELYELINDRYASFIEQLNATGMNDLVINNLPLEADVKNTGVVITGEVPGGTNVFADNTYVDEVEANNLDKPYTRQELEKALKKSLDGRTADEISKTTMDEIDAWGDAEKEKARKAADDRFENRMKRFKEKQATRQKKATEAGKPIPQAEIDKAIADEEDFQKKKRDETISAAETKVATKTGTFRDALKKFKIGQFIKTYRSAGNGGHTDVSGVVLGFDISKGKNPATSFILVASNRGQMVVKIPFGDAFAAAHVTAGFYQDPIAEWDTIATHGKDKELRYVYTGNLLGALVQNRKGQIVNYTTKDGDVLQGMLLPKGTRLSDIGRRRPLIEAYDKVKDFVYNGRGELRTSDKRFTIKYNTRDMTLTLSFANNSKTQEIMKDRGLAEVCGWVFDKDKKDGFFDLKSGGKVAYKEIMGINRIKPLLQYLSDHYKAEFDDAIDFNVQAAEANLQGVPMGNAFSAKSFKGFYDQLTSNKGDKEYDPEIKALANDVFAVAEALGIKMSIGRTGDKGKLGYYSPKKNEIRYKYNHIMYGDKWEAAETILHEAIHSVTSYAFYARREGKKMSKELAEAVDEIIEIQQLIKKDPEYSRLIALEGEYSPQWYGAYDYRGKNPGHENVAEMSNPVWREKLKSINLWDRFKNAVGKVIRALWTDLGLPTKDKTAFERMDAALHKMLDNFDIDLFHEEMGSNDFNGEEGTLMKMLDPKDEKEKAKIDELDRDEKVTGYRNVVLRPDGTFGSPMASGLRTKGQKKAATAGFEMGKWEMAEENPHLANDKGKIDPVKPDGNSVAGVDYNPYIHNRPNKVNKQFKQAWERPDLVYIQTEIPKGDLESGYHADKAAKSVGIHNWPTETSKQRLILSRYDKPVRIVPWEEVADDWEKEFKGRGVEFDIVPPKLLPILAERGVKILPPHKGMGEACNKAYKEWKADFADNSDVARPSEESGIVSEPTVQMALQAKQKADAVIVKMVSRYTDKAKGLPIFKATAKFGAHNDMFTNPLLVEKRRAIMNTAKENGGLITAASAGAFNTAESGIADPEKAQKIADAIIPELRKYRDALSRVGRIYKTPTESAPFVNEIKDVDNAIKWYQEFRDGMHNKIGDHADDGIRFRTAETTERDREYEDAVKSGDKEKAQELVDSLEGGGTVYASKEDLDGYGRSVLKTNPRAMGWYDNKTGKVHIYLPNCRSQYDVQKTVYHEKIGHEGLRKVLGEKGFNRFIDKIWLGMDSSLRREITSKMHKYGYNERVAVDEYLAEKAEDFTESGHSFWQTVKNIFNSLFNTHFGEKDVRMALWLSKHNMENKKGSLQFRIDKAAFQFKLDHYTPKEKTSEDGVSWEDKKSIVDQELPRYLFSQHMTNAQREQFRDGLSPEGLLVTDHYENELKKWWYPWTEAWRNNMKSAEVMLEAITGKKMADIESKYNVVDNLNQLSSKNDQAMQKLIREHIEPLQKKLLEIIPDFDGDTPQERYANAEKTYFYAKHALEANRVYAVRDYVKEGMEKRAQFDQYLSDYQKEYDKYDKKFSNGDISEDEFDNAVTNFINAKAMSMLGKKVYSEYKTDRDVAHTEYKNGSISIDNYFDRCNQAIESRMPSKDIDKFQGKFDAKRQQLKTDLDNGTITLKDYYDKLDQFIRTEIKDFDPSTHDMGGLSDYDTFPQWADKDTRGMYDDDAVINHIMDCESRMGKAQADAIWKGINNLSQSIIDNELNAGVLIPNVHERMSTMFSWYLPLRGFDAKTAEEQYGYIDGAKVGVGPSAFSAKGRTVAADRPVETLFHLASNSLMKGNRNIAKMAVQRLVADHKDQDLLTPFEAVYRVETDSMGDTTLHPEYPEIKEGATPKEIQTALDTFEADIEARKAAGEKLVTLRDMKTGTAYRIVRERDKEQHFIHVMVNGKDTAYIINANPRAAQAINGMVHDIHIKYWDDFNRLMSQLNTSYSMTFMAANAVRDWEYAALTSIASENKDWNNNFHKMYRMMQKNNATGAFQGDNSMSMRHLFKMYRENKLDESNQVQKWFKEFVDNGGVTGYVDPMDKNDFSEAMDDLIAGKFKTDAITTRTFKQAKKLFMKYGKLVDSFNEGVENHARFAAFCASRMEHRSVSRSVHDAKEISINFNRTGAGYGTHDLHTPNETAARRTNVWAASLSASYFRHASWFCNAGIQAVSRTFDLWCNGNKKQKALLVGGLCLTPFVAQCLVTGINAMVASGDDDDDKKKYGDNPYAQLPPYMRRNSMCFYLGHGRWAMVPLAVELRAFYGLADMGIRAVKGIKDNQNAVLEALQQFTQLSPVDVLAGSKVGSDDLKGSLWGAVIPDNLEGSIAMVSNVGWTGRRIWNENEHEQNKAGWAKAPSSANHTFVGVAKALNGWTGADKYNDQYGDIQGAVNLNPAAIQYFFESYMGGPGKEFSNVMGIGSAVVDAAMGNDIDWQNTNVPILKAIYHQQSTSISRSTDRSRWYEYKKEATNYTKSSLSDMRKHGNAVGYVKLYNSKEGKIMDVVDNYNKVIKALQTQKIGAKTPSQRNYYDNLINYYISEAVGEIDKIEKLE